MSKEICSVADAITIAKEYVNLAQWPTPNTSVEITQPPYNPPFGIWYRGQSCIWPLKPGAFREYEIENQKRYYDETSLFYHFQLRSPDFRKDHQSVFEWLCLMQHYGAPTRLLDWTESVLVALYFAIWEEKHKDKDGQLFILNARHLNMSADVPALIKQHGGIHAPDSFNVELRAQMAVYRELAEIFIAKELFESDETDAPDKALLYKLKTTVESKAPLFDSSDDTVARLLVQMRKPIAVLPYRSNSRSHTQQSTFTIHGGKCVSDKKDRVKETTPIGLGDFDNNSFLKSFLIPADAKHTIKLELLAAGIHKGSLFPELDYQSEYMREIWI